MNREIEIAGHKIGAGHKTFMVAEMSANHNMDFNRALEILHAAKEQGADAVKIQTYTASTITLDSNLPWFRINQGTIWDGDTLYSLYEKAYTPWEWHADLFEEAKKLGLVMFSTPFDFSSVDFLEELDVPCYKIASFEINDIPLIRKVAKLGKPMILATGIARKSDIDLAVKTIKEENNDQIVLLKCTSAYPAPYETMNISMIPELAREYECISGLSDHSLGCEVAVASIALGASVIEKHLTLRRSDGGEDSAFSMEPEEFGRMVKDIRNVEKALGRVSYDLSDQVARQRAFSRSLFVAKDIKKGEAFTSENLRSVRPGYGLHTKYYEEILGKTASMDISKGYPMEWKYVSGMEDNVTNDNPASYDKA